MPLDELTITLGDPEGRVSVRALTAALENALDMLRSIEGNFVASGVEVRWDVIRVKMKSPLQMTFAPTVTAPSISARSRQSIGKKIVKACFDGIAQIERSPIKPNHFDDDALSAARQLVKSMGKGMLTVSSNGKGKKEVKLTDQAIANIDEIATKARTYRDIGTIEGRLEEISVHGTPQASPQIRIWDPIPLPGRAIKCVIGEDRLSEAKELLGHRVAVRGPIQYRNHKPISIDVQVIRRLRTQAELPRDAFRGQGLG